MKTKSTLHFSNINIKEDQSLPLVLNPQIIEELISIKNTTLPNKIIDYRSFKLVIKKKEEKIMEDAVFFLDNIEEIFKKWFSNSNLDLEFKTSFFKKIKQIKNNDTDFFNDYPDFLIKKEFTNIEEQFNIIFLDSLKKYAPCTSKNIFRNDFLFNVDEDSISSFLGLNNQDLLIRFCINIAMSSFWDYIEDKYEFCEKKEDKKRLEFEDLFNWNIPKESYDPFYDGYFRLNIEESIKPIVSSNKLNTFLSKIHFSSNIKLQKVWMEMEKLIFKNIETTISIDTYEDDLELVSKIIWVYDSINISHKITLDSLNAFISNNQIIFEEYLLKQIKNKPYNELIDKLVRYKYLGKRLSSKVKAYEVLIITEPLLRYYCNYIIKNNPDDFLINSKLFNQLQIANNSSTHISVGNSYTELIYEWIIEGISIKYDYDISSYNRDVVDGLYPLSFYEKIFNNINNLSKKDFEECYLLIHWDWNYNTFEIIMFEFIIDNKDTINKDELSNEFFKKHNYIQNMYLNKDYFFDFKITESILKKVFKYFKSDNNILEIENIKPISANKKK